MKTILVIIMLATVSVGYGQSSVLVDSSLKRAFHPEGQLKPNKLFKQFSGAFTDGRRFSDDSLKNKVTMINFWTRTCTPCLAELEQLNKLYKNYQTDTNFRMVSFTYDEDSIVDEVRKQYNILFPVVILKPDQIYSLTYNLGFPTNMVIDQHKRIYYIKCGGSTNSTQVKYDFDNLFNARIQQLLTQKEM